MKNNDNVLQQPNSWISPHLITRENTAKGGYASYAINSLKKDQLLAVFGGTVVTRSELDSVASNLRQLSIQVDKNLYLLTTIAGSGDYINHSCDPNAGLFGQIGLVAMRDIDPGEEICFDYAMCDSTDYDEFDCCCGSFNCRGRVSSQDWRNPDLWLRYQGYFSPYLQKMIDNLRAEATIVAGSPSLWQPHKNEMTTIRNK